MTSIFPPKPSSQLKVPYLGYEAVLNVQEDLAHNEEEDFYQTFQNNPTPPPVGPEGILPIPPKALTTIEEDLVFGEEPQEANNDFVSLLNAEEDSDDSEEEDGEKELIKFQWKHLMYT